MTVIGLCLYLVKLYVSPWCVGLVFHDQFRLVRYLTSMSTALVMSGRSVNLTTFFPEHA